MSPKEWKLLKDSLVKRGLDVQTKGRNKKEYIVPHKSLIFDILRGGVGHSSSYLELYVYSEEDDEIIFHENFRTYTDVISAIDSFISE